MHLHTRNAVAVVRLPGSRLLARADVVQLAATLETLNEDDHASAVLLRGDADGFCGGLDLREFSGTERLDELAFALERCFLAFAHLTKPLVLSADGLACGFGATMLCHADIVILSERARIRMPFLDLGLLPEAGSTLLLGERIGHLNAMRLIGLGEEIDAPEAKAIGLATRVVAVEHVDREAFRAARRLARRPPALLSAAMQLLKGPRADLDARVRAEIALCVAQLRRPEARKRLSRVGTRGRAQGSEPGLEAA